MKKKETQSCCERLSSCCKNLGSEREKKDGDFVQVYKTNYKFDETNPWWDPHEMPLSELCNNNKNLPVRFTIGSYTNSGDDPLYGTVITTLKEIEMLPEKNMKLDLKDKKGKEAGCIKFNTFEMDMFPSFNKYLSEGWEMQVSIAIDFTLSNKEITDCRSLHRLSTNGEMNHYERVIFEVCNVLTPLVKGRPFNAYGFGGIPTYISTIKIYEIIHCRWREHRKYIRS